MFSEKKVLSINCRSWFGINSKGMFNYMLPPQNQQFLENNFELSQPFSSIVKNKNTDELKLVTKMKSQMENSYQEMVQLSFKEGTYFLQNTSKLQSEQKVEEFMWKIASFSSSNECIMKRGSIMMLGKTLFEIISIVDERQKFISKQQVQKEVLEKRKITIIDNIDSAILGSKLGEAANCRHCFSASASIEDPLISLCKCSGSSKFVHQSCLSFWIVKKSRYYEDTRKKIFTALKDQIKCEVCSEYFKLEEVLPCFVEKKLVSYIILSEKHKNKEKIHIIDMKDRKQILIGRQKQSTIVSEDLAVSRYHCKLYFDELSKNIYVLDEQSKFGSLIKCDQIKVNGETSVQKGRTKITVTVRTEKPAVLKSLLAWLKL